jgi:hypothetical protein
MRRLHRCRPVAQMSRALPPLATPNVTRQWLEFSDLFWADISRAWQYPTTAGNGPRLTRFYAGRSSKTKANGARDLFPEDKIVSAASVLFADVPPGQRVSECQTRIFGKMPSSSVFRPLAEEVILRERLRKRR